MINNVTLVSGIQQSDLVIHIHGFVRNPLALINSEEERHAFPAAEESRHFLC